MVDVPVASDLSFECFQKRLRSGELRTPDLNDSNRRLYNIPSQIVVRESFIASRETVHDTNLWDAKRRSERQQRILQG
jgi:hypothetical protein